MGNLKKIVKENLDRKYQMNESFEKIFLNENHDDQFNHTIEYLGKLIDEGYDNDKLEMVINEQFDWLKKLFTNDNNKKETSLKDKVLSSATSGGFSQFKEFLIKKFLSFVGFEGPLASAVATVLSEMTVSDLVSVFRGKESCMLHSETVAKAITESLVTYIIQTNTKEDSLIYNFLRNSLFEYLTNEGYMNKMGQFICGLAYKSNNKIMAKLGL
jgi:hypothetical protein